MAMKKTLLFILAAFTASMSFGQILNFSFENWTTVGAYEVPNQWGTLNNTTAMASVYTVTKATPGNPGSYYMKITSKTIGAGVVGGIAVCGVLDSINMKAKSGFPFNLQPASFTGKWQHMIYGSSQGSLNAILTKWNVGLNKRDTIAIASQTLTGMAMSWANFSINFNYLSSNVPDSCIIELRSSGNTPTDQDYLWVDNLAFAGSVTGIKDEQTIINNMVVYPNPGSDILIVSLDLKDASQTKLELTDIQGKVILAKKLGVIQGESKQSIDVSSISKGSYFVRVTTEKGTEVKKIIID
jgi:hypothetical protein